MGRDRKKAQIKRAGDAPAKKADEPGAKSPQPATATPADTNKWSSGDGNVLSWLATKTQAASPPKSRGAVDYLASLQQQGKVTAGRQAEKTTTTTTATTATTTTTATADVPTAKATPAETIAVPRPRTVVAEGEAKAAEGRSGGGGGGRGHQRGQRGQQRRRDDAIRAQRQAEEEREAAKRHEEAMRTDPEYQKQFQTYQELQAAAQQSQAGYFEKYARQENLLLDHIATERLDMPVILDLIDKHDVVFLCTDTGSGKSTNVPKALLELSPHTRVVSTQPRRTATVAIANRVASLRRERVGEDVGYWIRGEKRGDEQTRLWYMTSYTLLLRILEDPNNLPFTHVVLDEFHERQPDLEVTVALLRLALLQGASFKMVLMSATLNTEDWEQYFEGLKVATYKQSEPEHPIHDFFLEDTCKLLGMDYQAPPKLVSQGSVSRNTLEQHLYLAQALLMFLNGHSRPHHAVLVFLPGRAQVEALQQWLEAQMGNRVDVVPWHSAVDLSDIERAMKRHLPYRQKIYLATDIAEVSITLPDVVFVIDLVLVKRPKITRSTPASILYPPLLTQWISRSSVAQRRGRIGRVQQGFYFCLFPAAQIADLPQNSEPPMENSRIDELSLHCLQVVSNPAAIYSLCHGQPLVDTIVSSMNTLTQLGCIVREDDPLAAAERVPEVKQDREAWSQLIVASAKQEVQSDITEFDCTFIGRILQLIPVSPQPGMLVFYGFLTGLESLMILAAAATSSLSPFTVGAQEGNKTRRLNLPRAMEETENVMRDLCCGLRSDIVSVMKATLQFRIVSATHNGDERLIRQWCAQKHLSYDKLLAIVDLEQHIKYELSDFMPVRDVNDPARLLEQLDTLAAMVAVMTNVAFASQSLEVTSAGDTGAHSKEMAVGIFGNLAAVPDIHSPSCLRWQEGDIIIPVQLHLLFDRLLAGFSTAIESPKQFWMSLLLFSYRISFATFSDEQGAFHVFSISYCGRERFVEVDEIGGYVVLEFRRKLSSICATLRLTRANRELHESDLNALLAEHKLKPLIDSQREVISALVAIFSKMEERTVDEVEHEEDDIDSVSLLSFALPETH